MSFYNRDFVELTGANIDWNDPPFEIATTELRVDEAEQTNPALLVRWHHASYCGSGGCLIDIWIFEEDEYRKVASYLGHVLTLGEGSSLGYQDLWLQDTVLRWDGNSYHHQ